MKMTFEVSDKLTEEQINKIDILIQNLIFDFECENDIDTIIDDIENDVDYTGLDL